MRSTNRLFIGRHTSLCWNHGALIPGGEWPALSRSHAAREVIPSQDGTDDSVFVRCRVG